MASFILRGCTCSRLFGHLVAFWMNKTERSSASCYCPWQLPCQIMIKKSPCLIIMLMNLESGTRGSQGEFCHSDSEPLSWTIICGKLNPIVTDIPVARWPGKCIHFLVFFSFSIKSSRSKLFWCSRSPRRGIRGHSWHSKSSHLINIITFLALLIVI